MKHGKSKLEWLWENREWLFSGAGLKIISVIFFAISGIAFLGFNNQGISKFIKQQSMITIGCNNSSVQINETDSDALVKQLTSNLPTFRDFQAVQEELKILKKTIENLKHAAPGSLREFAFKALAENDTAKAKQLLKKYAEENTKQTAQDWIDLGNIEYLSDYAGALKAYKKATAIDKSNPNAWYLQSIVLAKQGFVKEAVDACNEAIILAKNNKELQIDYYSVLGNIYFAQSNFTAALKYYKTAIGIEQSLGNKTDTFSYYGNMAMVYDKLGQLEKAERYYIKAIGYFTVTKNNTGLSGVYNNFGNFYKKKRDYFNAKKFYKKALSSVIGGKQNSITASIYGSLGHIYKKERDFITAKRYYEKSFDMHKSLKDKNGIVLGHINLGNVAMAQGFDIESEIHYQKAMKICSPAGQRESLALINQNLGHLFSKKDYKKAESYFLEAMKIYSSIGMDRESALQYGHIGIMYKNSGFDKKACEFWKKSKNAFNALGDTYRMKKLAGWIEDYCN